MIHEMGHNWDDEWDQTRWWSLSGWVFDENQVSPGPNFQAGDDDSGMWFFDTTLEGFVSTYGRTNAYEDFAEAFTNFFMNLGGLDFAGDLVDITTLAGKNQFMVDLLADVS